MRPIIYDSRNYQVLIDTWLRLQKQRGIYDSRNYQVLIDFQTMPMLFKIYDSRNYQVLIDLYHREDGRANLR